VRAARDAAEGYQRLAAADTSSTWSEARAEIVRRELRLEEKIRAISRLRTYGSR
jgi:hypothetical protein